MIKLTGIIILFLSARLFYENYMDKTENGIKKAEEMILFCDLMYVNVMELKMPVMESAEALKFKISPFIDDFTDKFIKRCKEKPEALIRENLAGQLSKTVIDKKIKRELNRFFKVLGDLDKETVLNYKKASLKNCEAYLTDFKKESQKKRKTAGAICGGVSALLAIILI